ncbi:glycosyltransferase [Gemmobacter denitrificans]|uniref:Glycosyltransferase n=1 Tax=Gemmobacter denitrificans TaxID=3123040 RepID=A0ABU8BXZ2_9RHOB
MGSRYKNQIIGLMRFSYPSLGGFVTKNESADQIEARLYEDARLERRFHLFENLALPSLLAQSDQDFRMVFLVGQSLPSQWRDRLNDVIAPLKGARVVALASLPHYMAVRRAFNFATPDAATHVTGFRLDDDDALDINHVARMRATVNALLPVAGLDTPLVTGCHRGYFLEFKPEGHALFHVIEKAPGAQGLAMTRPAGSSENIFRRNHRFVTQFYNTYTDANIPAYIRTIHTDNDSDPHASGQIETADWETAAPLIAEHFPFTAAQLQAL